jgi:predicted molibdopterin-dependent oxidoreductase YjgC
MFPERDGVKSFGWDRLQTINKAVEPPGECKSDMEINLLVGRRFNVEAWPWKNEQEIYDALLKPWDMTFEELREKGPVYPKIDYRRYEKGLLRKTSAPGFTLTGRSITAPCLITLAMSFPNTKNPLSARSAHRTYKNTTHSDHRGKTACFFPPSIGRWVAGCGDYPDPI